MSVMSYSVRPHRRQPTRLPYLGFSRQAYWSGLAFPSPMQEIEKWKWSCSVTSVMSDSSRPHGLQPTRLLHPWDFPGKTMGVSCHFPLQRIFQIQGWNPHLLLGRQILYHWASLSSPFISAIIAGRLALWGLVGFPILRPCSIIPCAFPIFT